MGTSHSKPTSPTLEWRRDEVKGVVYSPVERIWEWWRLGLPGETQKDEFLKRSRTYIDLTPSKDHKVYPVYDNFVMIVNPNVTTIFSREHSYSAKLFLNAEQTNSLRCYKSGGTAYLSYKSNGKAITCLLRVICTIGSGIYASLEERLPCSLREDAKEILPIFHSPSDTELRFLLHPSPSEIERAERDLFSVFSHTALCRGLLREIGSYINGI